MKASIIVTSYNYGLYIERCLRSCVSQNFPSNQFEIIIVDDASTDQTLGIVKKYTVMSNVRLIESKENRGVAAAGNQGIRESFGQFVVRVDADDYINANFLLFLTTYLEANNELLAVACDYMTVDNNEQVLKRFSAKEHPISCGIMYRKDGLVAAGLYNEDFRHCEEKELRARLGNRYTIDYLRIPLYRYRLHGKNKTRLKTTIARHEAKIKRLYGRK
jgi:glycosyltransferase involved in cell wall biosynthesis